MLSVQTHSSSSGSFFSLRSQRGDTALIVASGSGSDSVVECLLENGAKVNHKNHVRPLVNRVLSVDASPLLLALLSGRANGAVPCHWQEPGHGTRPTLLGICIASRIVLVEEMAVVMVS